MPRLPRLAGLSRRRRLLLVLGVVLLAVRVVLPEVLRRVVEAQASARLGAEVEVGDVDLRLLGGGGALEEVALRPRRASPEAAPEEPLIAWKRLAVDLRWLPLLRKTIRLSSVELDAPRVALDRLESGDLNLAALVPKAETPPTETPPGATPAESAPDGSGWGFAIDRFILRQGGVQFRDLFVRAPEPVVLLLRSIEVADIALTPGVYGEPARLHVLLRVDEGSLKVDARLALRGDGLAVETDLRARRLPLHRSRLYIPGVGWSALQGEVGAALAHRFETGVRNEVRGTVMVGDVTVNVAGIDGAALAWRRLLVELAPVDVQANRAVVSRVHLSGMMLPVRPAGPDFVPLLNVVRPDAAQAPPPPAAAPAAEAAEPARPWEWSVASLVVIDSRVRLLGPEPALDVGLDLRLRDLAGTGDTPARVALGLTVGDGSVNLAGTARVTPPGFDGTLDVEQLALPPLIAAAAALPPDVLRAGSLGAKLTLALGSLARTPGDVDVRGTVALVAPEIAATDPQAFTAKAKEIAFEIEDVLVPGVVPVDAPPAAPRPLRARLAKLTLATPEVLVTRTPDGIVLPEFTRAQAEPATPPPATAPPPAPASAPAPAPAAAPLEVAIGAFRLSDGRILVTDRTVKPYYTGTIAPLAVEADRVEWPPPATSRFRLRATGAEGGKIDLTGNLTAAGSGRFEMKSERLGLTPFNPYATHYSPYSITRGKLTVVTKGSFRPGAYDATTGITLHDLRLGGAEGDSVFQQQFGIPLSVALALLRDLQGNIVLEVPVAGDESGTRVGLLSVVGGALRQALLGALASPLKLFGAVVGGDKVEGLGAAAIPFAPGRPEPTPEGLAAAGQLGEFLAGRPGLAVTLEPHLAASDVRWLREQALREELTASQGVLGTMRHLRERGPRDRVRKALEARAGGAPGPLEPEDEATLERWLAERPGPTAERLAALAVERVARIEAVLHDQHGLPAERIARAESGGEPGEEPPSVRLRLGAP